MSKIQKSPFEARILIDFSSEPELAYWSAKLNVRREVIKTAARACCSNAVSDIKDYLKVRQVSRKPRRPLL